MSEQFEPLKSGDTVSLVPPINLPPRKYQDYGRIIFSLESRGYNVSIATSPSDYGPRRVASFNEAIQPDVAGLLPVASNRYSFDIAEMIDYESFCYT